MSVSIASFDTLSFDQLVVVAGGQGRAPARPAAAPAAQPNRGIDWGRVGRAALQDGVKGAIGGGVAGAATGAVTLPVVGSVPGWAAGAGLGFVGGAASGAVGELGSQAGIW